MSRSLLAILITNLRMNCLGKAQGKIQNCVDTAYGCGWECNNRTLPVVFENSFHENNSYDFTNFEQNFGRQTRIVSKIGQANCFAKRRNSCRRSRVQRFSIPKCCRQNRQGEQSQTWTTTLFAAKILTRRCSQTCKGLGFRTSRVL